MDRFQPSIGTKPSADAMLLAHSPLMPAASNAVSIGYGVLSKLIEKQVSMASGQHAGGAQRQLTQFVFDLKKQFDRVFEENQRLLKTLAELQDGQDYLLQQLKLHHKREELAILREQQDGKRIRELENRLSFLLFEPIQNQRIGIDAPELPQLAIQEPEHLEPAEEPQKVQNRGLMPFEDDQALETSASDAGSDDAGSFPEKENPRAVPFSSNAAADVFCGDEFETAGGVPPLEARGADLVADALLEDGLPGFLDEETTQEPAAANPAVDEESNVIDLLEEVVDPQPDEDNWLSDAASIPDEKTFDYMLKVDEAVESSSLNTNFVLQDPRASLTAAEEADPAANEIKEALASIISLEDEIPAVRALDESPSIAEIEDGGDQVVNELSPVSFAEPSFFGDTDAITTDFPAAPGLEECLETVAEADTNAFDIIELKEDAIVGRPERGAAQTATNLMPAEVATPLDETLGAGGPCISKNAAASLKEQRSEPTEAKTHFERGKRACQSKDYAKAVDSFNRYLELSPNDPRGPYNLAILHYRLKEYSRAEANARKALDLGYAAADRIMAKIKTKTGSGTETDIAVEKSVSNAWLETETIHDLPLTEPAAKSKEEAAANRDAGNSFDTLLPTPCAAVIEDNLFEPATVYPLGGAIDPLLNDETAVIDAAGVAASQKPFSAVSEEPGDSVAAKRFFADGMAAYQEKEYRPAIDHFRSFVALMPDEPKGHFNLAILHYRLKEYETALVYARRVQDLGGKSAQKIIQKIESKIPRQCSAEEKNGGANSSQMLFEDRMNFPVTEISDSNGAEDTASIWDANELGAEINQSLFSATIKEKHNRNINDLIVFDSAALEDKNFGEDEPAGSYEMVPGDGDPEQVFQNERLDSIFKFGQTAIEKKEYLKAIQHFTKVTHLAPRDPRGYYHLAEVSFQLRFYETARQHAQRAIELGSTAAKNILHQISALQVPA